MNRSSTRAGAVHHRRGFSLVEVVICTLLVAVVLVGAMKLLGAAVSGRTKTADMARAQQMAQELMTEILNTAYVDSTLPAFGPELLEALGTRVNFDDVDDYHGWNASPPQDRAGAALANSTGWRHTVAVELVTAADPSATTNSDEGLKRVTVTISKGALVAARLVALRSDLYTP